MTSEKTWFLISFNLPPSNAFSEIPHNELKSVLQAYPFSSATIFSLHHTEGCIEIVVLGTEEDVRESVTRIKALLQITVVDFDLITSSTTRFQVPPLPELVKRIISQKNAFQHIVHGSLDNTLEATITPYKHEKDIVLLVQYKANASEHSKRIVHNCVLTVPQMKPTHAIFGLDIREDERALVESLKGFGGELTIGKDTSAKTTASMGKSQKSEKPLFRFSVGRDDEIPDGAAVGVSISKKAWNKRVVIQHTVVFLFTLPQDVPIGSIQVDSHFLVFQRSLSSFKTAVKRDTLSFSLHLSQVPSNPKLLIGEVVGYPPSEKPSFVSAMMKRAISKPSALTWTPYLRHHFFKDFILPNGVLTDFVFLDTQGYCFEPELVGDQKLLNLFVKGLVSGTDFSKKMDLDDVKFDPNNAPTHLILSVPVRDAYKRATWLGSWFGGGTATPHLDKLIKLYDLMLQAVAQNNAMDKHEAKTRVAILVTHMDMLPESSRKDARDVITNKFVDAGAPSNYIFFGEKECTWKERDLEAHERKVANFLSSAPSGEDYWKVLEEKNLSFNWLHIPESACTKLNCTHQFTSETQEAYITLLRAFLSSFE